MKKEEILEKSRNENKNKDMYAIEVESKACKYAALALIILATIYYCFEIFTGKGSNPAFYSMISLYCSIVYGAKALKIEKHRKLNTTSAIIWGILTIMLIVQYFGVL